MKFSGFFMFRWKVWEKLRSREPPIIRSRNVIPNMDMEAAGESGINRLHDHPYLKLRGKGTAVAVIDSGDLIIRMKCFEMQAAPESLIYGISP